MQVVGLKLSWLFVHISIINSTSVTLYETVHLCSSGYYIREM